MSKQRDAVAAMLLLGALNDAIRLHGSESAEADAVRQQLCELPDGSIETGAGMVIDLQREEEAPDAD